MMKKYLLSLLFLLFCTPVFATTYPAFVDCSDANFPLGAVRSWGSGYVTRAVPPGPGGTFSLYSGNPCGAVTTPTFAYTYLYYSDTDSLGCPTGQSRAAGSGQCESPPACPYGQNMQCDAGGVNCSCKNWCHAGMGRDIQRGASFPTGSGGPPYKACTALPGGGVSACAEGGTPSCMSSAPTNVDHKGCPNETEPNPSKFVNSAGLIMCSYVTYETGDPVPAGLTDTGVAASAAAGAGDITNKSGDAAASSVASNPANASQVTGEAGTLAGSRAAICVGLTGPEAEACAVAIGVSIGNSTGSGGGTSGSGSGSGDGSDFCESHPDSLACKDGTFSGACDTPVTSECALDPVICAIAQEDLVSDCALAQQYVTDHTKSDEGDKAMAGTDDGTTNNPAKEENRTHVSMSTLIPTPSPRFSRSPLVDITYNAHTAYPVTIPWSNYNAILSVIGQIGVVCALIAAVGIVFL